MKSKSDSIGESDPGTIAVSTLVTECYPQFGIPHFQRGLVWPQSAVGRLLESLFYKTPCGTIILWEPNEPQRHGVPLVGTTPSRYLIVDGQQRVRSLHLALMVLNGAEGGPGGLDAGASRESEGTGEPSDRRRIWCLNLTRLRGVADHLEDNLKGRPLFMRVLPPTHKNARFKKNLIPLGWLMKADEDAIWGDLELELNAATKDEEHSLEKARQAIKEARLPWRATEMWRQTLHVTTMRESKGVDLEEIVQVYNRINASGVRVEPEERAFAALVAARPNVGEWLAKVFISVHRDEPGDESHHNLKRDDHLKRQKEKSFGFKLFVRTFIQAFNYHRRMSMGSQMISFGTLERKSVQRALRDPENEPKITEILDTTRRCLEYLRSTLEEKLFVDDLRFLPDTRNLMPAAHLLLRFPTLMEDGKPEYQNFVSLMIFKLMIASPTQDELLKLVQQIESADTPEAAASLVDAEIKVEGLRKGLEKSNSLQDRLVLMLYWLERRRRARDFAYDRNTKNAALSVPAKRYGFDPSNGEVEISAQRSPEKQHIIPYSGLRGVLDIPRRGRVSRHIANNIGNITYISRFLNSFEHGVGSNPLALDQEPLENLRSHLLLGSDETSFQGGVLGMAYRVATSKAEADAINSRAPKRAQEEEFESFCRSRRKLIAAAFDSWLKELDQQVGSIEWSDVGPSRRILRPTKKDTVREYNYDDSVEKAVFAFIDAGGSRRTKSPETLELKWSGAKTKRRKFASIKLLEGQVELDLRDLLVTPVVDIVSPDFQVIRRRVRLPARGEYSPVTCDAIMKIVDQFAVTEEADFKKPKKHKVASKRPKQTLEEARKEWIALHDEASWEDMLAFVDAAEHSGFVRGVTDKSFPTLHLSGGPFGCAKLFNIQLKQEGIADSLHNLLDKAPQNDVCAAVETFRQHLRDIGGCQFDSGRIHLRASDAATHAESVIEAAKALEDALKKCG